MAETSSTQRTLDLVQALAVIVTGAWVLFRYFDHERDMASVQVQQQQLLNQQAALTQRITQDQKNLRMAELKNTVDIQSQDLEFRKLQQAKAQQELSNAQKYRFLPDATIATRMIRSRGKLREYEVDLFFGITNKSEGPVDVSASVVDYYLGVPQTKHAARVMVVEPMGQPTDRWNPKGALPGAIEWKQVGYAASMAAKAPDKMLPIAEKRLRVLNLIAGGPGTGTVPSGQMATYEDSFFVVAPEHAHIAFVMSYCFNGCMSPDDYYSYTKTEELGSKRPQTQRVAAEPPSPGK